jgi:hypothetical protein
MEKKQMITLWVIDLPDYNDRPAFFPNKKEARCYYENYCITKRIVKGKIRTFSNGADEPYKVTFKTKNDLVNYMNDIA